MPESTCLHIQDRESGPIRVVELPWISVRIGRAAYCEVCLPDDRLAEETCRLTRRGRTWSLVPAAGQGLIVLEGRPLEGPCPLPFDVPFRVGSYCLTLRHDVAAEPDWELYPATAPSGPLAGAMDEDRIGGSVNTGLDPEAGIGAHRAPYKTSPYSPSATLDSPAGTGGASVPTPPEGPHPPTADADRWRARWKAAEDHFKARASRLVPGTPRASYSTQAPAPRDPIRPVSPPAAPAPPPVEPPTRPAPTPAIPRIESTWTVPRPDPHLSAPRAGPPLRPAPPPRPACPHEAIDAAPPRPETPEARAETLESDTAVMPAIECDAGQFDELLAAAVEALPPLTPPVVECPSDDPVGAVEEPVPPASLHEEVSGTMPVPGESPEEQPAAPTRPAESGAARPARPASTAGEPSAGTNRPFDKGARKKKPSRERIGARRRVDPSRRFRPDDESAESAEPGAEAGPGPGPDLPSVREILANHRNSPGPRPAVERRRKGRQAVPTVPREPAQWEVPGWLALPPVGAFMLAVGVVACVLSCWWAADSSTASVVTQRLLASDGSGRRRPLPENVVPPRGRWVRTSAQHLAHWAIYAAGADQDEHPPATAAPGLVARALEVSPLNPTARLAMAQLEGSGRDGSGRIRGLGLSRDAVSLAWSARRLMESGKKEAGLRLYHRALSAAVGGGLSRTATPRYAEDTSIRRYFLPGEDAVRDIVADLAGQDGLEFGDWSRALPRNPIVLLATARLLREQRRAEADALLDQILGDDWIGPEDGRSDPRLLAARAEALLLRSRTKDAAEQYRQAIELVDNDLVRRSWWFNLADVAQRLNDEVQQQVAIRAALAVDNSDDITRRASLVQKAGNAKLQAKYGSVKAN